MNIVTICGLGILSAALCMIVRRSSPDAAFGISAAAGVVIVAAAVSSLAPTVSAIAELSEFAGIDGGFAEVLLKALAVSYITQLSADCCRDAGEASTASKIEIAGRAAIAVISLPVFTSLAQTVVGLL